MHDDEFLSLVSGWLVAGVLVRLCLFLFWCMMKDRQVIMVVTAVRLVSTAGFGVVAIDV